MTAENTVRFRLATPHDAAAITELVRAAYARWVPLIGREPMPMLADYAASLLEHDFDLLVDGEALVGVLETLHRDDHLWIENIAVHPDRQHQGFGRQLLDWAEERAGIAGTGEIRLLTNAAFDTNIRLYERAGYRIDRTEPFRGGITVYMSKQL